MNEIELLTRIIKIVEKHDRQIDHFDEYPCEYCEWLDEAQNWEDAMVSDSRANEERVPAPWDTCSHCDPLHHDDDDD